MIYYIRRVPTAANDLHDCHTLSDINAAAITKDFLWGVVSSCRIEGHPLADGASPSIWYNFSHERGKIHNSENADLACDHYHGYSEDIGHMKEIGIGAYRFSIAWPRIFPEPGKLNPRCLDCRL